MAKVKTSALIDSISGSLGGSTLKRYKGGLLIKNKTTPRNTRSASQQQTRLNASYLSGKWSTLPNTSKEMWTRFASLSKKQSSGINAFVGLNLNLIQSNFEAFSIQTTPPSNPSTPISVRNFECRRQSETQNTLYWQSPAAGDNYVSVYCCIAVGYSDRNKESWKLVGTAHASQLNIQHDHDLPQGFYPSYKARSIDSYGRVSPFTDKIMWPYPDITYESARYGQSAYGFCYYGVSVEVFISDVELGDHANYVRNSMIYGFGESIESSDFTIEAGTFSETIASAISLGISIFVRSTTNMANHINEAQSHYPGIQCFMPAGSNDHIQIFDSGGNLPSIIVAGGGDIENETGYDIEFFDVDPFTPEPRDWSSFANGVIAGKILKIKAALNCSFWEARYRARQTASGSGVWNNVNGYGVINVEAAILFSGDIPSDPYDI